MNIGHMLKVFQYGLLKQGGINVEPSQLGLKTDPFAKYTGTTNGSFSSVLGLNSNLTAPTPPIPPQNNTDPAAQQQFNQELVNYSQQLQAYNQNMMRLMLQQFQLMQQRIQSVNATQANNNNGSNSSLSGIGGILDGADYGITNY